MRTVFDTNVLIAALRSRSGASFRLLRLLVEGDSRFQPLLSVPLFLEYESVLKRPEQRSVHRLSVEDIDQILDVLAIRSEEVQVPFLWRPQLRDPKDEMVLEAAVNGRADVLVTFNRVDFSGITESFGLNVMTPPEFYQRTLGGK